VALVNGYAVPALFCADPPRWTRLRTLAKDQRVVDAKMEDELTLCRWPKRCS